MGITSTVSIANDTAIAPDLVTAVVIRAPMQFALEQVSLVPLGAADVFVRTIITSISRGTEKMIVSGALPPGSPFAFPLVPGYETVGVVTAVGPEADAALLGAVVYIGGGFCYRGVNAALGGQSSGLIVPGARVLPLGQISIEAGVLLALLATAVHAVERVSAGYLAGKTVAVLGNGSLGRLLAAVVRREQPGRLIVTETSPERYETAHPDADDALLIADDTVLPGGVDVLIDATGSMAALGAAITPLKPGGDVIVAGYYQRLDFDYMSLFFKEPRLHIASQFGPPDLLTARDLLASGIVDPSRLLTHHFGFTDIEAAYAAAFGDPACVKVVVHWGDDNMNRDERVVRSTATEGGSIR